MKLNDEGIRLPAKLIVKEKKEIIVPAYLSNALADNSKAATTFNVFSYSHKKEYVAWITGAKTDETRNKRTAKAIEMLAEGKGFNDKYAVKK